MAVYILEIPGSDFTGAKGGVDFYKGKGSTSSLRDARDAQLRGAVIRDAEGKEVFVESAVHKDSHVEILTARAVEPKVEIKVEGASAEAPSATPAPAGETPQETKPKTGARKGGRKK